MKIRKIPTSASHVKFENEHKEKRVIDLEHYGDVVNLQMSRGGANSLFIPMTPIEAASLRDALLALGGLPKSRRFVFYPRAGR